MKLILSILLLLSTCNIFAQNKHSELYNQVEMISRTVLKSEITEPLDTNTYIGIPGIKVSSNSRIVFHHYPTSNKPLLVIDGIPFENYNTLDSINADSIYSYKIFKPMHAVRLYGSRGQKGIIWLTTKEEQERIWNNKKKKRKAKSNN
jgi:hypothetical protein